MRVVVRREASWFDALSLPFQFMFVGTALVLVIVLAVPILIAIEVKAFFARHRIRKERAMGKW